MNSLVENRKKIAVEFLKMAAAGKSAEAGKLFLDKNGKHHNVYSKAGWGGLIAAMQESDNSMPNKELEVKRVICDGDLVAVHSHVILKSGPGISVVHILRFNGAKIIEMWDVGQMIPSDSPNKDGPF